MGKRMRIVDIADELGVSTATVSNVIHGKTKKISNQTVKRVQELLEKYSYIPSMAGILLAQNNSRIIGVVVNNHQKYENKVLEDPFIASALNALAIEIQNSNYFMMIKTTDNWIEIARYASMWNMDGLVLIGFCDNDYERLRDNMHIPFVVYDGYFKEDERICKLSIDNYGGGKYVGEYLYDMGHRKVLCLADNYMCMDKERILGCTEGMSNGQTDFLEIPMKKEMRISFYENRFDELMSYTAIFAVSDWYAIELIYFLQSKKVSVPNDMSVIGFDNVPWSENIYPRLTTVGQNTSLRAKVAIESLKELKNGECSSAVKISPVNLIIRDSVKGINTYEA